jgi:hypothetical protein
VDHANFVSRVQRFGRLNADRADGLQAALRLARLRPGAGGRFRRSARTCGVAPLIEQFAQRLAPNELHREKMNAVVLTDGKHGDDVRMIDLSRGLSFVLEARDLPFVDGG